MQSRADFQFNSGRMAGDGRCAAKTFYRHLFACMFIFFSLLWHQHAVMKSYISFFFVVSQFVLVSQSISVLSADCGIDGTKRMQLTYDHLLVRSWGNQ